MYHPISDQLIAPNIRHFNIADFALLQTSVW